MVCVCFVIEISETPKLNDYMLLGSLFMDHWLREEFDEGVKFTYHLPSPLHDVSFYTSSQV